MKIGMSLTSSYSIERDSSELLASLTDQVKLMAGLGCDSLSLGDHHLTHDHYIPGHANDFQHGGLQRGHAIASPVPSALLQPHLAG